MTHVLLVDDTEENLSYLQALLAANSYTVEAAHDGAEALSIARQRPPDLVISDLLMPVMDGYTLLRHWKADAQLRSVPFIVYTSTYTEPEDRGLAFSWGADDFILKPTEPDVFMQRVRTVEANGSSRMPDSPQKPLGAPDVLSKVYNQVLVRKLEQKTLELEETNRVLLTDIGERNSADVMLRLLNSAVMQSGESILITDAELDEPGPRIVFANPAFTRMTGYAAREVLGRTPRMLAGARTDRATLRRLRETLQRGEQFEGEAINYRKDGTEYLQAWIITPLRNAANRVTHFVAVQRDITERQQAQAAVRESLDRLALATRSAHIGVWDLDVNRGVLHWDAQTCSLFGIDGPQLECTVDVWRRALHADDRALADAELAAALAGKHDYHSEYRIIRPDGERRWLAVHGLVQPAADGSPSRMIGVNWDITERKNSETRIKYLNRVYAILSGVNALIVRVREREELFSEACRIAVEVGRFSMAMIVVVDAEGVKATRIASFGKDDALLRDVEYRLTSRDYGSTMVATALRTKMPLVSDNLLTDPRATFGRRYAQAGVRSLAVMPLIVGERAVGVLCLYASEPEFFHAEEMKLLGELAGDIAFAIDHIDKRERLEYLAYYDELTGLANRNLFLERVAQFVRTAASAGTELAVLIFDVERFRNVNDSLGRTAGDRLLQHVASWLIRNGGGPELWARVGSDHFALVLPVLRPGGNLLHLVERTMETFLRQPFLANGNALHIVAKAGIAKYPNDGTDAETLFRNAEAALKKAKLRGERYVFYETSMNDHVSRALVLENQLRQALTNNEFEVHYQPKVSLDKRALTGAEALLRWKRPSGVPVPPAEFIPVLEETGLIHEVGRWAMRTASADYLRWLDAGIDVKPIAVNVSPLQLRDRGFVGEIRELIGRDPRAAAGLELELTESMIMEDVEYGRDCLHAISVMGVSVALDDFGTGFSSLGYLAKLPLNTLKIDRSFVAEMTGSQRGLALVSTIISLARSLKINVVAEGVETEDQAGLLRLLNCDEMQGYLISQAVPADVFEQKFLSQRGTGEGLS